MVEDNRARFIRLDIALRDSFSKIRDEIGDIKGKLEMQLGSLKEVKKEVDDSKKDFVGIDKINALKIKIGDLREELKAVERLEKKLNEIEAKAAEKEKTEAKLDEIEGKIESIEKVSKAASPDSKVDKLVKEINGEFADLRKAVREVENKGGSIVDDKFTKLENDVNKRTLSISNKLSMFMEEQKKYPTKQEINQLLRMMNREFDDIKEKIDEIGIVKNDLKNMRREKVGKRFFEQQFVSLNGEIGNLKSEIEYLKRKGFKAAGKSSEKGERKAFNFYFLANFLIVLAFILLGVSLLLFFIGRDAYMDYLIYGAIISFVIGVLMRIVLVIRG
ncbi:hypothetical protein COV19_01310 [Candidatus Woesearchaeota archaeon CG10_big_fil_rev_8_21_14_0_10_44_13]|nr:MAG: hypothetical protein COV19_01310 [Candidatus Woesearchaeota archaeon CG10_big_fil_rev_8_21_14_0_10_44_13]